MMRSYAVDYRRWKLYIGIGVLAVLVGGLIEWLAIQFLGINPRGLSPILVGTGIFLVFDRVLWKYPPFNWLHSVPNLGGTWEGQVESSYSPEDQGELDTVEDESQLRITQRWSKMEVAYSNPNSSSSRSISVSLETETDEPRLTYTYENEPVGEGLASPQTSHRGTAVLRLRGDGNRVLRGSYYTNQEGEQTYGSMRFEQPDG